VDPNTVFRADPLERLYQRLRPGRPDFARLVTCTRGACRLAAGRAPARRLGTGAAAVGTSGRVMR